MRLSAISLVPENAAGVTAVLGTRSGTRAAPGAGGHTLGREGDALYPGLPRRRLIFKCMFSGLRRAAGSNAACFAPANSSHFHRM